MHGIVPGKNQPIDVAVIQFSAIIGLFLEKHQVLKNPFFMYVLTSSVWIVFIVYEQATWLGARTRNL